MSDILVARLQEALAILAGLLAWGFFLLMAIGPRFENEQEYFFSPRFDYTWTLSPVVLALVVVGFTLGDGFGAEPRRLPTALAVSAGLALFLYWAVPWIWNAFFGGTW